MESPFDEDDAAREQQRRDVRALAAERRKLRRADPLRASQLDAMDALNRGYVYAIEHDQPAIAAELERLMGHIQTTYATLARQQQRAAHEQLMAHRP
jgi:hypothetical protein